MDDLIVRILKGQPPAEAAAELLIKERNQLIQGLTRLSISLQRGMLQTDPDRESISPFVERLLDRLADEAIREEEGSS